MKASEFRKMTAQELDAKLLELKDELFKLRFQQTINQLENPMRIRAVKKDIARLLTGKPQRAMALNRKTREKG